MLSWGRYRDHSSKLGLHWGCWVCGRPRWRGSRLRQMVWPRGRCLSGAATELGLSHFLKQVGEGKRRKERKQSQGPWLSDWCFIYLISFDDFTYYKEGWWWYLMGDPSLHPPAFRLLSQTFPASVTLHPQEELLSLSDAWGAKCLHTHWPTVLFPGDLRP